MTVPRSVVTPEAKPERLLFIDNIRIFLTMLVILHHLMVIYASSGSWIYLEKRQDDITTALGEWFCSVNQSYFMGLFLFISAYFVPGAYDRKGGRKFLKDRLIRLGIPLAMYAWIIRPLWIFFAWAIPGPFWIWYKGDYFRRYGYIGGGPLWFIEVLLIFALCYALYRAFKPRPVVRMPDAVFPRDRLLVLFAFLLGIASFIVQLWFPSDTSIPELNLQLGNFPQYIALFILGLMAYPRSWFVTLPDKTARRWMIATIMLSVLPLLVGFDVRLQTDPIVRVVESLISNWWNSFMCVAMCISVVYISRRYFDRQGQVARWSSRDAYTAYLIHEPVITSIALAIAGLMLHPLLKFASMGLVTVPLTFLLSALIRKIPRTDRVL